MRDGHKWHGMENKCEPERNAVQTGGKSIPLAYIMSYLLKMEDVIT